MLVDPPRSICEIRVDLFTRGREVKAAIPLGDLRCQVHQPIGVPMDGALCPGVEHAKAPTTCRNANATITRDFHENGSALSDSVDAINTALTEPAQISGSHMAAGATQGQMGRISQQFTSLREIVK